jgi:hypothetical protein
MGAVIPGQILGLEEQVIKRVVFNEVRVRSYGVCWPPSRPAAWPSWWSTRSTGKPFSRQTLYEFLHTDHAAHNLAVLKHITLNLILLDPTPRKGGIEARRLIAATSDLYRAQLPGFA